MGFSVCVCAPTRDLPLVVDGSCCFQRPAQIWINEAVQVGHRTTTVEKCVIDTARYMCGANYLSCIVDAVGPTVGTTKGPQVSYSPIAVEQRAPNRVGVIAATYNLPACVYLLKCTGHSYDFGCPLAIDEWLLASETYLIRVSLLLAHCHLC